jgi:ribosomal protein S18 acetylase RimI-like enzyme
MKNFSTSIQRFVLGLKRPSKQTNNRLLNERSESLLSLMIREARIDDIPALAALHVKAWSETYWTTLSPPAFKIREYQWQQQFKITDGSWFCFVVENKNSQLVGFAKGKAYSHPDLPEFSGELNNIYLLRKYQRLGLGRKLVGHVARRFLTKGIFNMVLFGTAANPSSAFHDTLEGERLYARNGEFHGGYCWRDLKRLAEICPID